MISPRASYEALRSSEVFCRQKKEGKIILLISTPKP
jgi:hypothetical protein